MESPKNHEDQKKLRLSQRLLLLMVHEIHLMFLLILLVFQFVILDEIVYLSVIPEDILVITLLFILLSALLQLITYKFWIPMMRKKDDLNSAFFVSLNVLNFGAGIPSVFGLIIGIFGYNSYNYLFWPITLPFILIGFFYSITLYLFIIKPFFSNFQNK